MASEDSDQFVSGLAVVHGLRDLCNLDQAGRREMTVRRDDVETVRELLEIRLLRGTQWMSPEERDDDSIEVVAPGDRVAIQVLLVVVVAPIDADAADTEEVP